LPKKEASIMNETAKVPDIQGPGSKQGTSISVDVVIPVLNEAHVLEKTVATVLKFLHEHFPYQWKVLIVDNGSTDGTDLLAARLSAEFPEVDSVHLKQRGRGLALRHACGYSKSDVVCYMDVDLSTDLSLLVPLVHAVAEDGYDIAIGSRLMKGARIMRSLNREVISRIYNWMLRTLLSTYFSDAQCGFKAFTRRVIQEIVPQIENQSWFFDSEMLVLAEKQGYRIKEIPVVWIEDVDSRVKILSTSLENIKAMLRLRRRVAERRAADRASAEKLK
jgi:glycosyltransferase involved in cell wall biosynthesis